MSVESIGGFNLQGANVSIITIDEFRPCGECKACCTVIGVAELNKGNYLRCKHLCGSGCKIYDTKPTACTEYQCGYRFGLVKDRPDRIGLIVDYQLIPLPGAIRVWEVRKGAANTRKGKRLISMLRKKYDCEVAVANKETTTLLKQKLVLRTPTFVSEPIVDESIRQELIEKSRLIATNQKSESYADHTIDKCKTAGTNE